MYVALVFNERFRESKCNFPLRPHQRKFRLIPSDLSLTVTTAHISLASFDMSERERMINDSVFFSRFLLDFFFFFTLIATAFAMLLASQSHLKSGWKKAAFGCSAVPVQW